MSSIRRAAFGPATGIRSTAVFVVVFSTLLFAGAAAAGTITGSGSGVTIQKDGSYMMAGTWVDTTTGTHGTYSGSYTAEPPANFTSCQFTNDVFLFCGRIYPTDCNLVF